MARVVKHIDIGDSPDLLRVVEEVQASNEPRILRHAQEDVAILRPIKQSARRRVPKGRPTSADDPVWKLVGIGASKGAGDISTNKHAYLADAYGNRHE